MVRIENLAFMQKRTTLVLSAISAITAGISILNTSSAQAVIITGSVTGTWDDTLGSFNPGDVFIAEYTYNDADIVPYDLSDIDPSDPDVRNVGFNVPLKSLKVTVGSAYSHIFDFSDPLSSFGEFFFQDFALLPPTHIPFFSKIAGVDAYDGLGKSNFNNFSAARSRDQEGGMPSSLFNSVSAGSYVIDLNTDSYVVQAFGSTRSNDDNVTFSPDPTATAVPAPAVFPGVLAAGALGAAYRKRQSKKVSA